MWLIRRTKPLGEFYGYAIPVFIWNMQYHLTTVNAYSDGAIDAWRMLDLNLFEAKLKSGWIWPQPPQGGRLGIFNLGFCTAVDGEWLETVNSIRETIIAAVQKLNPKSEGLIDMQGSDTELRGTVRYSKLRVDANERPCRIETDQIVVDGKEVPAFELRSDAAFLTSVFVFADGLARIGTQSELLPIEDVFHRFATGLLTTSVADGTRVTISDVGSFTCTDGNWTAKSEERVKEIKALLAELNGSESPVRVCVRAHGRYELDPSAQNLAALREAYEAVPEHLRMYCGDMDSKDHPIRRILFPDSD